MYAYSCDFCECVSPQPYQMANTTSFFIKGNLFLLSNATKLHIQFCRPEWS